MSTTPASLGVEAGAQSDVRTPAVASLALTALLHGAPQPWRVMGATSSGSWLVRGDTALVVTTERSAALPNAVIVSEPLPAIGGGVRVGQGAVAPSEWGWRIARWWDPRPTPLPTDRATLLSGVASARQWLGGGFVPELGEACDAGGVMRAAQAVLGRGRGLTPYGDDLLGGFVCGWRYAAWCLGEPQTCAPLDEVRHQVLIAARERTTVLSLTLLRHAWCGEVARPVAALLRSLAGRSDVAAAVWATTAIGHSSGRAMATGVLGGVAMACEVAA